MAFSSLRDFIDRLEKAGRLVRVGEQWQRNKIKRAAVRVRKVLGLEKNCFHKAVGILLRREGDADLDQPFETRGTILF